MIKCLGSRALYGLCRWEEVWQEAFLMDNSESGKAGEHNFG